MPKIISQTKKTVKLQSNLEKIEKIETNEKILVNDLLLDNDDLTNLDLLSELIERIKYNEKFLTKISSN